MKATPILILLLGVLFAAGCEVSSTTDDTSLTITDGTVSSFQTKQDNIIITAPGNTQSNMLVR